MSEKLTQYPWVAELYENSDMGGIYIYPEDGTCYPVVEDVSPEFVHLIASAPRLAAFIDKLANMTVLDDVHSGSCEICNIKREAAELMALARGEQEDSDE